MITLIKNANVVTRDEVIENAFVAYENGIINYVGKEEIRADKTVDCGGGYLVPGFIDLHCHGCLGLAFNGADVADVKTIADYHLSRGTTTLLATTSTASIEEIEDALTSIEEYLKTESFTNIAGIHMEGPWVSPTQCGAQDARNMIQPSSDMLRKLKEKYPSIIRVGAAPERCGGMEFGDTASELGILAAVAHSDAEFTDIEEALKHGYRLMTHLYSGMKGTERKNAYRIAGAIEGGLYFDDMYVEIIADGKHLPIELLKFIYKCKGRDRICLVTDAIRAAGLPNGATTTGVSVANRNLVIVEDDVGKVQDRSCFAGSTATADRLYRTMAAAIGGDLVSLSRMVSLTPARLMGFEDRGEIAVGKRADLVILDKNLMPSLVILNGESVV